MNKEEIIEKIMASISKKISLGELANLLELSKQTTLGYIKLLKENGENILVIPLDDDIFIVDGGERIFNTRNDFTFETNESHEFKFTLISDTRMGSKYEQLALLKDVYNESKKLGITNVIHAGNICEGIYPSETQYEDSLFVKDTLNQIEYIIKNYPSIDGITTYILDGTKEKIHLQKKKIDLGKRVCDVRDDMIYLGVGNCFINVDKVKILLSNLKLEKTYTESYQIQKVINSIRSEDKPDIYICGGLLKFNYFPYRFVKCISVPSLVGTTPEMIDQKSNNVVGAWYGKIITDKYGYLKDLELMASPYYETSKLNNTKVRIKK